MGHFILIAFASDLTVVIGFSTIGANTVDFNVDFLLTFDASSMDDFCDMAKAKNPKQNTEKQLLMEVCFWKSGIL